MQRFSWLVMLGLVWGCSEAPHPPLVVKNAVQPEEAIPAEIAELFERRELVQAIELLTIMIEKQPTDAKLYSWRSTAKHHLGRHDDAIADLDRSIALNPQDARLFNNRGFMQLGMERFEAALSDFDQAAQRSERFANVYNNRGLVYIATQRFDDAIEQFNRAVEIDPQYIDAYNNRGFAELEAGQIEQALDDFNVAIQLNDKYVNAFNNRGLLRARAGDFENAAVDFTQAMMLDPLNPKYYQHRREVYLKQGFPDKALADEKKWGWLMRFHQLGAKIANSVAPVAELTERANHFLEVNDLERARDDLDRAISLDPQSAIALAARAAVHLQQKSMDLAKTDAEASLAIEPLHQAYSVLGDVFLSRGDYDRAIQNFAHARRVDTSVAEAYYGKSKELADKGEIDQSRETLQQALVLDPDVEHRLQ